MIVIAMMMTMKVIIAIIMKTTIMIKTNAMIRTKRIIMMIMQRTKWKNIIES